MAYDHIIMFVRTRRNTTEGVVSIASNRYIAQNPDQFTYYSGSWIIGDSFEYAENGYGDIIVTITDSTHEKHTPIVHKITINNVKNIEISTHFVS